ncbi:MAG: hypothetical protein IJQ50_01595 [Clostridia bacterium]|nr:hypothetical protein [Clostridia bacterium]
MNFRKLVITLTLGICIIAGTVASAATYTTTTSYDVSTKKVTVTTALAELTEGSMVTYVLYGPTTGAYSATNNAVTPDPSVAVTESNIVYMDQDNNVSGTTSTFQGTFDFGKVVGSAVKVGSSVDTLTAGVGDTALDQSIACFALTAPDFSTTISAINVLATSGGNVYSFDLTSSGTVNIPYGYDLKITVTPVSGTVESITIGSDEIDGTGNVFNVASTDITGLAEGVTVALSIGDIAPAAKIISIDSLPYVNGQTVTFFVTADSSLVESGIDLTLTNNETVIEVKDLLNLSDSSTYAIQITDTSSNSLIGLDGTTYSAVPFYMDNANKVVLTTNDSNEYYYTVSSDAAVLD